MISGTLRKKPGTFIAKPTIMKILIAAINSFSLISGFQVVSLAGMLNHKTVGLWFGSELEIIYLKYSILQETG